MGAPSYTELEDQANRMAGTLCACADQIERLRAALASAHPVHAPVVVPCSWCELLGREMKLP